MCSGSLLYLLDLPVRSHGGGFVGKSQLLTSFWTFTSQVQKESGRELVNQPLP
jgi:hypothetical protein